MAAGHIICENLLVSSLSAPVLEANQLPRPTSEYQNNKTSQIYSLLLPLHPMTD
jgi:hypothetical protein